MLKISSNPKIVVSIEADFSYATKLGISVQNCNNLEKRAFLMLQLLKAIKNDINKTQAFIREENSPDLF